MYNLKKKIVMNNFQIVFNFKLKLNVFSKNFYSYISLFILYFEFYNYYFF